MSNLGAIEASGDRSLSMAIFTVTNLLDSGAGSLRQAIVDANANAGADEIVFDEKLLGGILNLTDGELTIADALTIRGLNEEFLTIAADKSSRIFKIEDADDTQEIEVFIEGLTISAGFSVEGGGGIFNRENLTLTNSKLTNNSTPNQGSGIYNLGSLIISQSEISGNSADLGGGIYNRGILDLEDSQVFSNKARSGGGIYNENILKIANSEISKNSAKFGGGGIFNSDRALITKTTIYDNDARGGGGIENAKGGDLQLDRNNIFNNQAMSGGGIYNNGTAILNKNIISGNIRQDVSGEFNSNGSNSFGSIAGSTGLEKDQTGISTMANSNSLVEDLLVSEPLPNFAESIESY
ncbi:MAG: hypothetical protein ACRC2R_04795 [Xenococcaceae cyanobacterium]